jgi:hypothetical protein
MKRWRPDSIALTIVLTIVLSMGLGFTLQRLVNVGLGRADFFSGRNPVMHDMHFYYFVLPTRVVALAEALDASSADQRLGLIAAAQRQQIQIQLLDTPLPGVVNSRERFSAILRRRIHWFSLVYHPLIIAPKTPLIDPRRRRLPPRLASSLAGHRTPARATRAWSSRSSCTMGIGWCSRRMSRHRGPIRRRPRFPGCHSQASLPSPPS